MSFVEFTGPARIDRRTKNLTRRLSPDDIAIIDHRDLDRVSAEELIASGVRVVVNVNQSQSGRYPNPGPLALVRGGVRLIDAPGAPLFDEVTDGEVLSVRGGGVYRNGSCLATGQVLVEPALERALAEQQSRVTDALHDFAENTMRYLRDEGRLLSQGIEFPTLRCRMRDRHALVVARGPGHKRDLSTVRPYVRDFKPVLIAVDGGAEALLQEGLKPDVIVGDMDSVSDRALKGGAEIVVHAYAANGKAPGAERLDRLGVEYDVVAAPGISEDVALLLAYEKGASLIVAVGTHFNLIEFLERDRAGMSSTFVTRLKVGEILIDAKGVSRLASRRVGLWPLVAFALAGLAAIVVAIAASPALRHLIQLLVLRVKDGLGI
ncbi:MAG TPA: putative cytokinetic ring protein SteA [Gaiellaceae bacterium]